MSRHQGPIPYGAMGGIEVLETVERSASLRDWRYRVRYLECGHEGEISHVHARMLLRQRPSLCRSCSGIAGREKMTARHRERMAARAEANGAYDAHGYFWPMITALSRLGIRNASATDRFSPIK